MSVPPLPVSLGVPAKNTQLWVRILVWASLLLLLIPPAILGDNTFRMGLFAKYLSLAILALGVDLIWGYTGMLSLGQGLYFALGAYCVGYSLEMQKAAERAGAVAGTVAPNFMNYTNLPVTHPDYAPPRALQYIAPLANSWTALAAAIVVPMIVATLFGLVTFRLRIRGVYFSLITQALLLAIYTLVLNQQPYTGGFVGLKDLADLKIFGFTFNDAAAVPLYFLTAAVLVVCLIACSLLVRSKFGKVLTAIRDNENRVLAMGYNPATYKIFVFAVAAGLSGLAGALYTVANGLCGPEYLSVAFSIDAVILVAVGGRGTLFGAVLGAIVVSLARTHINEQYPEYWPIILGGLFVGSVLFLPEGIVGGVRKLAARFRKTTPRVAAPSTQ